MATSNIQESGLENSIFFLEPSVASEFEGEESFEGMSEEEINEMLSEQFYDYVNHDLLDNMDCEGKEGRTQSLSLFDQKEKEWIDFVLEIRVADCYYVGCNLIINSETPGGNQLDLEDYTFSKTSEKKIKNKVAKLEKVCRMYSTELRRVGGFSNGESVYEEVKK